MKRRTLLSILALLLITSLVFAGCQKTNDSVTTKPDKPTETQAKTEEQEPESEHYELECYIEPTMVWDETAALLKEVESYFNITLKPIVRPGDGQAEWYSTRIAAGEMFDYIFTGGHHWADYDQYIDQEVVTPLDLSMIEKNMPNTWKFYKKYEDNWGGDTFSWYERDGKYYSIPVAKPDQAHRNVLGVRQDWLDNLGLKVPETPEDMDKVLQAFTEGDPDGDGEDNTYGFTCVDWPEFAWSYIMGAYDAYMSCWYVNDAGEFVYGSIEPGMKDALTWLQKWYTKGWIDPETVTSGDWGLYRGKIVGNQAGCTVMNYHAFIFPDDGWFIYDLKQEVPEAEWTPIGGLKGPSGAHGLMQFDPLDFAGMMFTVQMEGQEGKMERYMQLWDAMALDLDWITKLDWGYENETYTYDETAGYAWMAPYDKLMEDESIKEELAAKYGVGPVGGAKAALYFAHEFISDPDVKNPAKYYPEKIVWDELGMETATGKYNMINRVPEERPMNKQYSESLRVLEKEYIAEIIKGDRPVSDFDVFVEEWLANGGQEVLDEAKAMYEKYFK